MEVRGCGLPNPNTPHLGHLGLAPVGLLCKPERDRDLSKLTQQAPDKPGSLSQSMVATFAGDLLYGPRPDPQCPEATAGTDTSGPVLDGTQTIFLDAP